MKKNSSDLFKVNRLFNRSISKSPLGAVCIFILIHGFLLFTPWGLPLWGQAAIEEGQVTVKGLTLSLDPMSQTVPINTPTAVNTIFSLETPQVLKGMTVKGELQGPGLSRPIALSTLPNHPFSIPGLPRKGDYYLENIRLEREGEVVLTAEGNVLIQAMDLVVTRVESRPLSLQEIREKGISITDENFSVYHFSVGLLLNSEEVKYEFPVVYAGKDPYIPKLNGGGSGGVGGGAIGLPGKETIAFEIKPVVTQQIGDGEQQEVPAPKMTGILVFNNDIAFLNQFFSVMFIISNSAPQGSELTLKDLKASITFPEGLREAETNPPHIPGTAIPVHCPGPDKKLGTADDLTIIMASFSGMAEFLAEGLQEGTHYVTINFDGTLSGLPSGDTPVKGTAKGAVIVRNPQFSITFSHPRVVRSGEEYDIFITITNTSPVAANLVSLTMPASRIINCKLLSDETASFDTIAPGQAETVQYRMESLQNGEVRASAFEADGNVVGKLILTAGVGEQDIPLSPDTLVLPNYCYKLPNELLNALVISLGEAYSIAITPPSGVPPHLPLVSRDAVKNRIIDATEAGQRVQYGDDLGKSVQVLALDWLGNRSPYLAFDILRRMTSKGTKCSIQMSTIFNQELSTSTPGQFQRTFAETCSYKNPFISAVLSFNNSPRIARLEISDFYQNTLNGPGETGSIPVREIPYAELFQMEDSNQYPVDFALVGNLEYTLDEQSGTKILDSEKTYSIRVLGLESGSFDLSLIVPHIDGTFRQVEFPGIPCQQGSVASFQLSYDLHTLILYNIMDTDPNHNTTHIATVSTVTTPPLQLLGAFQDCTVDAAGRAAALFFNRPVSKASAKIIQNYSVENKNIYAAFLQPSERVILLGLDSAISPFVARKVTVAGLVDTRGVEISPPSQERTIVATIAAPGGLVYGKIMTASGVPVPNAWVRLGEVESERGLVNSYTRADANGNYQFDFVRVLDSSFELEVVDPATGRKEKIVSRLRVNGQRLNLDVFMRGMGNVSGEVVFAEGIPSGFIGAYKIVVYAYVDTGSDSRYLTARCSEVQKTDGWHFEYKFFDVPLGAVNLRAWAICHDELENRTVSYEGTTGIVIAKDGQDTANVNLTLSSQPTGSVAGCVLLSDGVTPVKDVYVRLERNGKPLAWPQYTDADGKFYFEYAGVGTITLSASLYRAQNIETGLVAPSFTGQVFAGQTLYAMIILRGSAQISGTVLEYNGTPLAGANVFVQNTDIIATSDENGQFLLTNVPVGSQTLTAYLPGTGRSVQSKVDLYMEGQTSTVNIVFPAPVQTGSIHGTVHDANGALLADKAVRVYDNNQLLIKETETDGLGFFQVDFIPVGRYLVVVNPGEGGAGINQAVIQYPGDNAQADVSLKGQGTLKISVYGSDGQSGVKASLEVRHPVFRESPGRSLGFIAEVRYLTTDDNGKAALQDVYMGSFAVKAWNGFYPQGVSSNGVIAANNEEKVVDLVMTPPGEVTVKVVSYDGETVVPGAHITFTANSLPPQNADTDPDTGLYTFILVPAGGFTVEAKHPEEIFRGKAGGYVPTAGGHVNITVRLKGVGTVNVTVKDQSLQPQVIPGAQVSLRSIQYPNESHENKICSGGFYSFINIFEGPFIIEAYDTVSGLGGRVEGTVAGHGDIVNVTLYLEASGSIAGYVLQPDEHTITANAQVILYNQASGNPFDYATTGSSGAFRFDHVPHGSYRLEAYEPSSGRTGKAYAAIQAEGEVAEANVRLEGRGTIEGYVYDGSGNIEVPLAAVILDTEGSFPITLQTTADQSGYYLFDNINEGPFTISAGDTDTGLWGKASGSIDYDSHRVSLNIITQATGVVNGIVYEADGTTPVPNAFIELQGLSTLKTNSDCKEGDEGKFTFINVPTGNFTISVDKSTDRNRGSAAGSLTYHDQHIDVVVVLDGLGTVSGTVKDSSLNLVPLYTVEITDDGDTFTASTGTDGAFRFPGIRKGTFSIEAFNPAEPINGLKAAVVGSVTADGQEVTVDLVLENAGRVFGRVLNTDASTPAANVYVTIKGDNVNLFTITGTDGTFLFKAVRIGNFVLRVLGSLDVGLAKRLVSINVAVDIINLEDIIPDKQKPGVTAVSPETAKADVNLNAAVTVEFSEAMDEETLTDANIKLLKNGAAVAGTLSIAEDKRSVTFTPSSALIGFTLYTVMVGNNVTDTQGNQLNQAFYSTFTTLDQVPPLVVAIAPLNNAVEVSPTTAVTVTFSEFITQSAFASQNMTVSKNGVPVAGTLEFPTEATVRFVPTAILEENSLYVVEVRDAVDTAGNVQAQVFSAAFSTVDTLAPTLVLTPLSGGTAVVEGTSLTVNADVGGAVDIAKVYFFLNGTLSYTDTVSPYRYSFTAPLVAEVGNTFIVDAYAVDKVGNQSTREYLTYTLISDGSPQVTLTGPASTTVYPGDNVTFNIAANDDVALTQVTLTAVGGTLNHVDTRNISQAAYSANFPVTIPADMPPAGVITVSAEARDSRTHVGTAPAILLNVPNDQQDPQVTITYQPQQTEFEYGQTITITANATDDVGMKWLNISKDNETSPLASGVNTVTTMFTVPALQEDQDVTFKAKGEDLAGKPCETSVMLTLGKLIDDAAPVVKIDTPTGGSHVFPGEVLSIRTTASDDIENGVASVELFVNGQSAALDDTAPYEFTYTVPTDAVTGTIYTITALVTDQDNKTGNDQTAVEVVTGTILPGGTLIAAGDTTYDTQTIIINAGIVTITGAHTFNHLLVKETGQLTHKATDTVSEYNMELTVGGQVTVGPDARIDAGGKGYPGGRQTANGLTNDSDYGRTLANTQGSYYESGASYGGYGGQYGSYAVCDSYGSPYNPNDPGSGGGGHGTYPGGNGGGAIRIQAADLVLDGQLLANGGNAASYSGGGSGGSIYLDIATLKGIGLIQANGSGSQYRAGGGGGRIAIFYQNASSFDLDTVTAWGGKGYNGSIASYNGCAGTIYLEKYGQTGELLVKNNSELATLKGTSLKTPAPGTITALEPGKLTDANANFTPGSLVGMLLQPNIENAKNFIITGNTVTEILVEYQPGDDLLQYAQVGDQYRLKYRGEVIVDGSMAHITGNAAAGDLTLIAATLILDGTLEADRLVLQSGSVVTHSPTVVGTDYSLFIKADEMDIGEGCSIDTAGRGYPGAYDKIKGNEFGTTGITYPNTLVNGSGSYCGGSYGGYAGHRFQAVNKPYGSITHPGDPGSGGGGANVSLCGFSGGGVIRLQVGTLTLNGSITADSIDDSGWHGIGSGGSIRIDVTTLEGIGTISADGGNSNVECGAGSGGRIALYYQNAAEFDLDNVTAYGGMSGTGSDLNRNGSAGTIYLEDTGDPDGVPRLIIANRGLLSYQPLIFPEIAPAQSTSINGSILENTNANYMPGSLEGMILVPNIENPQYTYTIVANDATTITVDGNINGAQAGDTYKSFTTFDGELKIINTTAELSREVELTGLTLTGGSLLRHPASSSTSETFLDIKASASVFIDSGSRIDVTGKGYLGGYQKDNTSGFGKTLNNTAGSSDYAGGSYGGQGGNYSAGFGNITYGSLYKPLHPGSGGGSDPSISTYPGGSGGGVIHITTGLLEVNGSIVADGETKSASTRSSGGSGGSILLEVTTLKGPGTITANGGSAVYHGAGGGGRVAIYYAENNQFDFANIHVTGGQRTYSVSNRINGGAGTIYLNDTANNQNHLIIDNNNVPTSYEDRISTPLPALGQGSYTALLDYIMSNDTAAFIPGALIGIKLNPQPQGSSVFTITGNTATEVFTDTNDGSMSGAGSGTYVGEHHLYFLTVKGSAIVSTTDRIIVDAARLTVEAGSTLAAENIQ